jgi:hypothetical protein
MSGCVANTDSIDLTVTGSQLTADTNIDPGSGLPPNPLEINTAGLYVQGADGWLPLPVTLAYSSADSPTFVATTSVDLTSFIGPGDKIRLVQSAANLYFIVTAIGSTTITLYGGTLYTLANSAITAPYFSKVKSPIGFTLDPANWSQVFTDTTSRVTATPTNGVWISPAANVLTLTLPIGTWDVSYKVALQCSNAAATSGSEARASLSTSNNSESDPDFTVVQNVITGSTSADAAYLVTHLYTQKTVTVAAKTPYFLIYQAAQAGLDQIAFVNAIEKAIIKATLSYL